MVVPENTATSTVNVDPDAKVAAPVEKLVMPPTPPGATVPPLVADSGPAQLPNASRMPPDTVNVPVAV